MSAKLTEGMRSGIGGSAPKNYGRVCQSPQAGRLPDICFIKDILLKRFKLTNDLINIGHPLLNAGIEHIPEKRDQCMWLILHLWLENQTEILNG